MRREELLSLRLHEAVAHKLKRAPNLLTGVRARVTQLSELGQMHPHYQEAWLTWLTLELDEQLSALISQEETWISMRQVSPFAGVLETHERAEVLRRFREEWSQRCGG